MAETIAQMDVRLQAAQARNVIYNANLVGRQQVIANVATNLTDAGAGPHLVTVAPAALLDTVETLGTAVTLNIDKIKLYRMEVDAFMNEVDGKINLINELLNEINIYIQNHPANAENAQLRAQRDMLIREISDTNTELDLLLTDLNINNIALDPANITNIRANIIPKLETIRAAAFNLSNGNPPANILPYVPPPIPAYNIHAGGSRFKESKKTRKNKKIKRRRAMKSKRSKSLQKGGYLYGKSRGKSSKHRINKSFKATKSSKSSKTTRSSRSS
jgi:hypothetical protein